MCPTDPWQNPNDTGTFLMDPCPADDRRLAVDFTIGGEVDRIYDRNRAPAGGYDIHVDDAMIFVPIPTLCSDAAWTTLTWTAFPGG